MKELVIASHNKGKVKEISDLLSPYIEHFYSAGDLNLPEPEETADTFEGNAILKAEAACIASGKPALADDSGLCVNALGGDPGIYSARWGGESKDFNLAMRTVHEKLGAVDDRSAFFVCVLALAIPGEDTQTFRGEVHGDLIWPPRGDKGFGYDPMFVAKGYDVTFAEMQPSAKHAISHRAKAFDLMVRGVFG